MNKKDILENICKNLEYSIEDFEVTRLDDISADLYTLKDNERGLGGIIISDDGTNLVCGTIYPIDYYIKEFQNNKIRGN